MSKIVPTTLSRTSSAASSFRDLLLDSQQAPQQQPQHPVNNAPRQVKGQVNNFHHLNPLVLEGVEGGGREGWVGGRGCWPTLLGACFNDAPQKGQLL